tara:strand:+ start:956 stop:1114 length:159 start_codon:yes stop_codon:yes gene_type:complete
LVSFRASKGKIRNVVKIVKDSFKICFLECFLFFGIKKAGSTMMLRNYQLFVI